MRTLSTAERDALAERSISLRNLVWITAKDRETGAKHSIGFWDDVGTVTHSVVDALTGVAVARTFIGAGSLMHVEDIAASADLSIKAVRIELSGIDANVADTVRGYESRLAPIQIYRTILNPATGAAYASARARFVGIVDTLEIKDPKPGERGGVTLQAVSQLRELARANPDMTSHDSQKRRLSTDAFYQFANDVVKWRIMWGAHSIVAGGKKNKKERRG